MVTMPFLLNSLCERERLQKMADVPNICEHCGKPGKSLCGACGTVRYCSKACQKAGWPAHKAACKLRLLAAEAGEQQLGESKGIALVLTSSGVWDRYSEMWAELTKQTCLEIVFSTTSDDAMHQLGRKPKVVLAVDESIALKKNAFLADVLLAYVKQGGTLILCGFFCTLVRDSEAKMLFNKFTLPWKFGGYERTEFEVSELGRTVQDCIGTSLPSDYDVRAYRISGAAVADCVYIPKEGDEAKKAESPVVLSVLGSGRVGFLGDVNLEQPTWSILNSLCNFILT
jgi:hypothetical protein